MFKVKLFPPPLRPHQKKKNGPCLNERNTVGGIDVIMNAAACYSLKSYQFFSKMFKQVRGSVCLNTGHFYFGGGGGGGGGISRYSTVVRNAIDSTK